MRKNIRKPAKPKSTKPPSTPPTIAPTLTDEEESSVLQLASARSQGSGVPESGTAMSMKL